MLLVFDLSLVSEKYAEVKALYLRPVYTKVVSVTKNGITTAPLIAYQLAFPRLVTSVNNYNLFFSLAVR